MSTESDIFKKDLLRFKEGIEKSKARAVESQQQFTREAEAEECLTVDRYVKKQCADILAEQVKTFDKVLTDFQEAFAEYLE
jgi:hypothetical protein